MIFFMHECEEKLGYTFKDKSLLRQCFTHSSYSHEHGNGKNNERLEFFGDSILGYITAEYLMQKYPDADEGQLTAYKQQLVSRKPLAAAIVKCGLSDFILYGEGERKNTPDNHEAANENLFEAIVAGIYLDGGIEPTKKFVYSALFSKTRCVSSKDNKAEAKQPVSHKENGGASNDFKSLLQIYVQKNKLGDIAYIEKERSGPAHEPTFVMEVSVAGVVMGKGRGKTKSEATKAAAKEAYTAISADKKDKTPAKGKTDKRRAAPQKPQKKRTKG